MREVFLVGVGGFLGANARYLLGGWVAARLGAAFPYGTFVINITGSFILGTIMGALEAHTAPSAFRLVGPVGFVGAYTTFSTFTYETARLVESGNVLFAAANAFGSLAAGMAAAVAGLIVGRLI